MSGNLSDISVDTAEILAEPIRLRCMNLRKLLLLSLLKIGITGTSLMATYIIHYKQLYKSWVFLHSDNIK